MASPGALIRRFRLSSTSRIKAFVYLATEKAPLYRAIMRVFVESKERFLFQLSKHDVFNAVRTFDLPEPPEQPDIDSALAQLCEWGNLQADHDTANVTAVEDFYKQRYAFQITRQGEAAERASSVFEAAAEKVNDLHCGLADIRDVLRQLRDLSREPNPGKTHRSLFVLHICFEEVASAAQMLISRLERRIELEPSEVRHLIVDTERFVSELVLAVDEIGQSVRDIEAAGLEQLFQSVAHRIVRGSMEGAADNTINAEINDDLNAVCVELRSRWDRFRNWFISQPGSPSSAERVRERARASIPALLAVITSISDQRIHRIDRSSDFRILARWFAEADSDEEAHRLWRAVFGLCPARHLSINNITLDDYEAQDIPANTSWLDAPPLRISLRLQEYGSHSQNAGLSRIVDRTLEKEKLAAATHEQALRILNAHARFGTGRRMRLSELENLDTGEFDLFLDLLGEAVSARVFSEDVVEIVSGNGCLRIKLEPTGDGQEALIHTGEGTLSGPDHWIGIEQV